MSLLSNSFRPDDAEDMSFDPIPVGWYVGKITSSEVKITSSGTGEYIKNVWEIIEAPDPKFNGRKVFQNCNIVKIGKSMLKQICSAIGIEELQDTEELVGVPLKIKLKIKPASGGYDASNDITKVKPLEYDHANEGKSSQDEAPPWNE